MSNTPKKWFTVRDIAYDALMDLGEDETHLPRFIHFGLNEAKRFHIDQGKCVKTDKFKLLPHKAIKLPDDFVDWVKIGFKKGDKVITFTHDKNIALHHETVAGKKVENAAEDTNIFDIETVEGAYAFHIFGNDAPIYGLASKDNGQGYFRVHYEAREIQCKTRVPKETEILLEYISDGWDPEKVTYVLPLATDLIRKYILFQHHLHKDNVPGFKINMYREEYLQELDDVSWRMFDLTVEDVQELIIESYVPVPQF